MYKVRKMDKNVTGFRVRESYLPTFLLHYFPSSHFPGLPIPALRSGLGNPFLLHYFHYFHHYTTSLPSHFPGLPIPALRSGLGNPSLLHYFHYFTTILLPYRPTFQACQSLCSAPGLGILHYFTTSPLYYFPSSAVPGLPIPALRSGLGNPSLLPYFTTSLLPHFTTPPLH